MYVEDASDDDYGEVESVEDENGRPAFIEVGDAEHDEEDDEGGTDLGGEDGGREDLVGAELIDLAHGERHV